MEDDVVIRIRGLKKSYRITDPNIPGGRFSKKYVEYPIFDGIDLDVKRGDIVGILGKNGCGKSTFLKLVSGILEPDAGTVEVEGKVASILELSMGFHGDLSGRDNIILRSELYGIPRSEAYANLDRIIEYSDLGVFIDNPVRTYSSGMRSRLAFSVMVNVDADIFLVDEALSTGDMAFAAKASEHLRDLVRKGKTVLFTSHSLGTIKRTCTRAIWLNDHKIAMDGPAEDVCDTYSHAIMDSFEDTLSMAEGGASSAQYRLSTFYRDGNGTERDPEARMRWLKEAAVREHPMAMSELADILMASDDEEDRARALDLYQGAAEQGNFEARRKYSTMFGDTHGDIEDLRALLRELARTGYPYDLYNCGNMLYRSALSIEDYREAFRYVKQASDLGWADADYLLGVMYREGTGVDRDIEESVRLMERAADNGHSRAMTVLAEQYLQGKYVPRDPEKAFRFYMMSASSGNARSQYQVATMYSSGLGCEKDPEKAKEWFARYSSTTVNEFRKDALDTIRTRRLESDSYPDLMRAASLTCNPQSMVTLASRYMSGKGGFKKNPGAAARLLERASVAGGSPRTRLAMLYLEGTGVPKDEARAFELLHSAAAFGDAEGMFRLSLLYKEGKGCEADPEMYRVLVKMAAERGSRDAKDLISRWDERNQRRKAKKH